MRTDDRTVLVIDDEMDYAAFLAMSLRTHGLSVHVAHDGLTALETALRCRPDVITLDIQMPHQSGIWFYRKARSLEWLREVPIIVVTGLTKGDREMNMWIRTFLEHEGIQPPFDYLEKPVDSPLLWRTVDAALNGESSDREQPV